MTAPARPETPTIKCEGCNGYGTIYVGPTNESGLPSAITVDESQIATCPLCNGTGRELATVTPREPK